MYPSVVIYGRLEATIGCFLSPRPKLIGRQSHLKLSREVAEEITIFNILMEERSFYVVETKNSCHSMRDNFEPIKNFSDVLHAKPARILMTVNNE